MHTFHAMNTTFFTVGLDPASQKEAEQLIHDLEMRFSRFRPNNETAQLNQSAGQVHAVSSILYEILTLAHAYYEETNHIFNPYLGDVVRALGYNQSFETLPSVLPEMLSSRLSRTNTHETMIILDPRTQTVRLTPHIQFDPGGIVKGWSADYVRRHLMKAGSLSGLVDAGGDIATWGMDNQGPWGISIADPFHPDEDIAAFWLRRDAGIATSSSVKRSWQLADGQRAHHILDPRTHTSAASDLVQVTVITSNAAEADVYAKTILILGSAEGEQWVRRNKPELVYVLVTKTGRIITGGNVSAYCTEWEGNEQCHI